MMYQSVSLRVLWLYKPSFLWTVLFCIGASVLTQAQNLYTSSSSEVKFFSSTPLEDIEAVNKASQSMLNGVTKEIAVKVPVKSFVFPKSLMQEHFNENYMESDKYPYAIFKGKINEAIDFTKPGTYDVSATGKLNIHGVERDQTLKGKLTVQSGKALLDAAFDVLLVDHKIKVPEVVFAKIAEKIAVTTHFVYVPYEKKAQ
ncbi:YceI family protein [Cytophagaceae bacterium DM2B3-1]|uniref:YceI family protein n=1 Tax=Xanthocytophaga flava TaxID=3048013 RepID=A0ABT7CIL3_9BACT|nr:YceI family protein [Xanthocytophaga flavus]MDJ1469630.1 YceI family protein [Xanthocytophaga flavus]MDJ1493576.1 YceI family protein [Xanthocytophaga flavus]